MWQIILTLNSNPILTSNFLSSDQQAESQICSVSNAGNRHISEATTEKNT